jgi:exodeoxyribonuclease VII large subunit
MNPQNQLIQKRQYLTDIEEKLSLYMERILKDKKHDFLMLASRLDSASPLKRLESGYAYVEDEQGHMIDSAKKVKQGDSICIHVLDGKIQAEVTETGGRQTEWI